MTINDTTLYNELLEALDNFKTIYVLSSNIDYGILQKFIYYGDNNYIYLYSYNEDIFITPSSGYTSSDLYVPQNLISAGLYEERS